ncbi:NlpC/P60 family protein [Nocardia pseudobrasiliensis]|uniref:N-acetylmuramoyl-L-alanine amidase n=1 Tax=Nocardia pseudobrasiliensis TaxID=45979 RepID=A0A370IAQ4_9NOCA|nr:NlpC/P60 family protein [Nocardia pseudobrasiliensis]RDI67819.1 N-acetylmuramoyl-L-alanine amidase [Nocardia pseudobrasiliensis]
MGSPEPPCAFVDVAAATVWTTPDSPRPVDAPALTNPVDIPRWLADMTLAEEQELTSDNLTQTQALYGDRVYVVGQQADWAEVLVPGQPTPKNPLGYPGWIPRAQLTTSPEFDELTNGPFALVRDIATAWLHDDPGLCDRHLEISAGTRLPVLGRTGQAISVATPRGGPKWLDARGVEIYAKATDIPQPAAADLVGFANMFLGRPYLWGGRAAFGFDCSGFTSTTYQVHGITLPRDAGPQATDGGGRAVAAEDLQAGDLLFYASDSRDPESIYHVAMAIGGGRMIEAFDSTAPVRVTELRFGQDYWGARRYLRAEAAPFRDPVETSFAWGFAAVTRKGWAADESLMTWTARDFAPVQLITVHHTFDFDGSGASDYRDVVRALYEFHASSEHGGRGWGDLGYHLLIDPNGVVYAGRETGDPAPIFRPGAVLRPGAEVVEAGHVYNANPGNIGICLIGNFDATEPTAAALIALRDVLGALCSGLGLDPLTQIRYTHPATGPVVDKPAISGHRDWSDIAGPTTCPGQNLYDLLPALRAAVGKPL